MQEIYLALSGATMVERRMDALAHNLANANTAGFRASRVAIAGIRAATGPRADASTSADLDVEPPPLSFFDALYAAINQDKPIDFTHGSPRQTNQPADLLINGEGFFCVQTPQGERYTRQGNFVRSQQGALTTLDGAPVLDAAGRAIALNSPGFTVRPDGTILDAEKRESARLRIVDFADKSVLAPEGDCLFRVASPESQAAAQPLAADRLDIQQGWLEGSNVQVVDELVDMISTHRDYEAYQKLIRTSEEMNSNLINA